MKSLLENTNPCRPAMIARRPLRPLALAGLLALAGAAHAQTAINQTIAIAGAVTPGDTPGFPVTLSEPGSYKLTSNLVVPAGLMGIMITAPNVNLDLNGYAVVGPVVCTGGGDGLTCTGNTNTSGIWLGPIGSVVRNGSVTGFGAGVYGTGVANGFAARAEQLRVFGNANMGIQLNEGSLIRDNVVHRNGLGIATIRSIVMNNVAIECCISNVLF